MLLITLNTALLKNGVLKLVPIVQNKIFKQKRLKQMLGKCSPEWAASWSSQYSSSKCCSSIDRRPS